MRHGPRWSLLNYMTKNGNRRLYNGTQYISMWERGRTNVLMYPVITIEGVMYLKDRSPYLDSSFLCSESQNTIRVNLLGTLLHSRYSLETYLSTLPSLIRIPRSISYKCP